LRDMLLVLSAMVMVLPVAYRFILIGAKKQATERFRGLLLLCRSDESLSGSFFKDRRIVVPWEKKYPALFADRQKSLTQ
jgi:hypothetical protein